MYNRYIPKEDGSWQKSRMPDSCQPKPSPQSQHLEPPFSQNTGVPQQESCIPPQQSYRNDTNIGNFFRSLLPANFDTGDLIIVLLLLLIAGDCSENRNTALLTLALYFFM